MLSSKYLAAIPRPGICPPLTPPSEFCPSDYDECKYDWDCDEPSKKCCSNGCYKICASPAVAAVQLQGMQGAPARFKTTGTSVDLVDLA